MHFQARWYFLLLGIHRIYKGYDGYNGYKGHKGYKQQPQPQPQPHHHHHQQWRRPSAASTKVPSLRGGTFVESVVGDGEAVAVAVAVAVAAAYTPYTPYTHYTHYTPMDTLWIPYEYAPELILLRILLPPKYSNLEAGLI